MFKKGSKNEAKNYRPISLLPLISKVIEQSIQNQTQDYLQKNVLLYSYQSGFRAPNSTDTCLPQLTDMILNGAENGNYTGMISIDLQKAFDTLDHKILFAKMKCIGFSNKTINFTRISQRAFFSFHQALYFGSRNHKLRRSSWIYIGIFVVFAIQNVLNKDIANLCDWFVDNKLSIHFGEEETKCILFSRDKDFSKLNIRYNRNIVPWLLS